MARKKSNKAKEKKLARRAEVEKQLVKREKLQQAMFEIDDHGKKKIRNVLIPDFESFSVFEKDGTIIDLECTAPSLMDEETKQWICDLTKDNMMQLYINAHWGWADAEKRRELMDDSARFLIARRREDKKPVAFSHFRFLLECDWEVLYLYELQLEESVRRMGLGRHIMTTLELIGHKWQMKWVMLTVFKENTAGMKFYVDKMNYRIDELSPSMNDVRNEYTYEILSKCIDPQLRKADARKFRSRNKLHTDRAVADEVVNTQSGAAAATS